MAHIKCVYVISCRSCRYFENNTIIFHAFSHVSSIVFMANAEKIFFRLFGGGGGVTRYLYIVMLL